MKRSLSVLLALGIMLSLSLVTAAPALAFTEVWVDDVTDPLENGSIEHPFDSIQEAIEAAFLDPGGGIVHVLEGTYDESIDLRTGVDVLGAGADVTTINHTGTGQVVSANGVDTGTRFKGFTITGGDGNFGGGMHIYSAASPVVSNCIFTGNSATSLGGGMHIDGSSPTVASCIFEANTTTGYGGGICCWNSSCTIINNTIVNNTATSDGGGIYVTPGSTPTIANNIIAGNTAASGGGIYADTGSSPAIDYNDVWDNTGGNYGGIATAGTNDISEDPVFNDAQYHIIYPDSPCIDTGDNSAVPAGITTDFEGDPRTFDGDGDSTDTVDMGADEYYVAPTPTPTPTPSGAVGGEVHPIDKATVLMPWFILSAAILLALAAGGLVLIKQAIKLK